MIALAVPLIVVVKQVSTSEISFAFFAILLANFAF
jgi:hypothetical protein